MPLADGPPPEPVRARVAERAARLGTWFDVSPTELVGLAVLLVGAAVASVVLWWTSAPQAAPPLAVPTVGSAPTPALLVVHVAGEVARPGVVRLSDGARVGDAIAEAGGPGPEADLAALNLARHLDDGEQVIVPKVGEPAPAGAASSAPAAPGAWRPDGRLDLNRATSQDLEELPGIGPVLAQRVIAWRDEHGPFEDVGQLREVAGIGERTLANLADLVTV